MKAAVLAVGFNEMLGRTLPRAEPRHRLPPRDESAPLASSLRTPRPAGNAERAVEAHSGISFVALRRDGA